MAGAASGTVPSSRRKNLDAEINLVPFIDLLSMCICFLLMTAVWIQIGSLQVKQSSGTEAEAITGKTELALQFSGPSAVDLLLKKDGKLLKKSTVTAPSLEELVQKLDGNLASFGAISAAMITPRQGVSYGNLVTIMDVLRKHQILNLGVVPVGEK